MSLWPRWRSRHSALRRKRLIWQPAGMPSASRIAHGGMAFANPLSDAAVDAAIAVLRLPSDALVLDSGCGSGEILLRVVRRHAGAQGLGVDLDADAIAEARERAAGLPARFEVRDAATIEGSFDAVINVGASHAHGGFPAALNALQTLGGAALYGEGFWERPPSDGFSPAWAGRPPTSSRTSTACAPRSGKRASTSRSSGWPVRTIGRVMRERLPQTPSVMAPRIRLPTHAASATAAGSRAAPTLSDSRCWSSTLGSRPAAQPDPLTPGESRCVRGSSRSPGHAAPAKGSRVAPPPGCRRARRLR